MDSSDLYHVRQQFTLGAYKTLANLTLPDASSPDHDAFLLYKARSLIALGKAKEVSKFVPVEPESLSLKAVRALARFVQAEQEEEDKDVPLEELRDLCVEVEGEDVDVKERWQVRVLAGTAFARAGEVEEALETLGVGTNNESLEAVSLVVQIYLSISRADLAKKEHARALNWAEDDLLLQSIEAAIGLATGSDAYADSNSFYTEQLGNPSLASTHLLASRGVARLLRGEVGPARSDLEEVLKGDEGGEGEEEALCASVVAAGLGASKKGEADELFT
ncbi:uncharacterized protein FOMMEDRAFT_73853 [Fomitiporia mediterranea MF3/22]|uniref:uncharacterized protein n=1 Tax=Fomitiporia mediterranea (strain MF3/22) TaxID=694068 RepID=UPI00044082F4|nr:uncharacterized protein FOMMEDRAFT_73853 [Fomitiporia mediterranea MF3/22]EJD07235.1 hypothetical protein FOMMEDRAFT_73853 [Fomitiporia mediterranea MF3/22]